MALPGSIADETIRKTIKDILKNADLSSLSSKKVRKIMEEKFQTDLTQQKQQIDDILMALINAEESDETKTAANKSKDEVESGAEEEEDGAEGSGMSSGGEQSSAENGLSESSSSKVQKKKRPFENGENKSTSNKRKQKIPSKSVQSSDKTKVSDSSDDDNKVNDEALARKLQQEELGVRPRSSKKVDRKPKNPAEKPTRKKGTSIYSQECVLSEELASVMGTNRMARKDVVSRMWQIFKERNLMDPKKKQYVICDEQLERLFKTKKFKAFGMMKILKNHIKDDKFIKS